MTRTERLLRLARLRGDRLAIATLERQSADRAIWRTEYQLRDIKARGWTEAELRAAWGDR